MLLACLLRCDSIGKKAKKKKIEKKKTIEKKRRRKKDVVLFVRPGKPQRELRAERRRDRHLKALFTDPFRVNRFRTNL
jgi:hypothetical protein